MVNLVAYLNCQILVGAYSSKGGALPTQRSMPNMNMLGSAFFEILPIIAQIFVLGAQLIQFSYTIGLCLIY